MVGAQRPEPISLGLGRNQQIDTAGSWWPILGSLKAGAGGAAARVLAPKAGAGRESQMP